MLKNSSADSLPNHNYHLEIWDKGKYNEKAISYRRTYGRDFLLMSLAAITEAIGIITTNDGHINNLQYVR